MNLNANLPTVGAYCIRPLIAVLIWAYTIRPYEQTFCVNLRFLRHLRSFLRYLLRTQKTSSFFLQKKTKACLIINYF